MSPENCYGCGEPTAVAADYHAGPEPRCWQCLRDHFGPRAHLVIVFDEMACGHCGAPTAPGQHATTTVTDTEHLYDHDEAKEHSHNGDH